MQLVSFVVVLEDIFYVLTQKLTEVVDSILDSCVDLMKAGVAAGKVEGEDAKKAAMIGFVTGDCKETASRFAQIKGDKTFFISEEPCLADIVVYHCFSGLIAPRMPDKDMVGYKLPFNSVFDCFEINRLLVYGHYWSNWETC